MKQVYARLLLISFVAISFAGLISTSVGAGVDDFKFSSFDADYFLSKDKDGRSNMKVVERLTAEFDNPNQNKGIIRAIPAYYDGHKVSFKLESLTRNGQAEPIYEQKRDGEFEIVSTGTEDYLNGTQLYVLTYSLRDVVKDFGDHQELYWDTNGLGWEQTFEKLDVRVHLDDSVKSDFTGAIECYQGPEFRDDKCNGYKLSDSLIAFSSNGPLYRRENLSFVLGFNSGTFVGYKMGLGDYMPYILLIISGLAFIVGVILKLLFLRNQPGKGTIVPEYLPPKNTSVLMAAEVFDKPKNSSTAQIIDLAVRHKIKIIETEKDAFIGKTKQYSVELISTEGLNQDEISFVHTLFSSGEPGSSYTFNKSDPLMGIKLKSLTDSIKKTSIESGYRFKKSVWALVFGLLLLVSISLLVVAMFLGMNNNNMSVVLYGFLMIAFGMAIFVVFKIGNVNPLTSSGRELFDYLKGLKMYIKLAEKDRLKVLQSAQGAEKKAVDTNDKSQMIVLFERVLPYAVLFGQEKSWLKELGKYYEGNQAKPDWYVGTSAFNAAAFASSVGSFSSYAGSSSFSSSSGLGGGGFSGGGGGGGGGGGR